MTNPISNMGSSASDELRRERMLSLGTARNMLPLVRRIVHDLSMFRQALVRLLPEQDRLDRERRTLDWPARSRRYQVREEIAEVEHNLQDGMAELEFLGIDLLDPVTNQAGFPTIVNGRDAYFSWRLGEDDVMFWHFAGESTRRRIPSSWTVDAEIETRRTAYLVEYRIRMSACGASAIAFQPRSMIKSASLAQSAK